MVGRSQRNGEPWTASSPLIRLGKRGMFAGLHGRGSKPRERGGVANNLTTFIRSQACWKESPTSKGRCGWSFAGSGACFTDFINFLTNQPPPPARLSDLRGVALFYYYAAFCYAHRGEKRLRHTGTSNEHLPVWPRGPGAGAARWCVLQVHRLRSHRNQGPGWDTCMTIQPQRHWMILAAITEALALVGMTRHLN
jgi:hypothetical protein